MSEDTSSSCSTSWLGRLDAQRLRYSAPSYSHRWLVVLASHVVHVVVYGTGWTVGVWNSFFLNEFGRSAASTAWIGSILNSVMLIVSFGTSLYIERLGCRNMVIAGGVITCAGYLASSLATSVLFLYFSFALIGVGLGFCAIQTVVIVFKYSKGEGESTIALGIASSGIGTGMFIYPLFNEHCAALYGWRTTIAVNGVISLFALVGSGLVFRLPKPGEIGGGDSGSEEEVLTQVTGDGEDVEPHPRVCAVDLQEMESKLPPTPPLESAEEGGGGGISMEMKEGGKNI